MEDAVKVISTKFNLSADLLNKVSQDWEQIGSWITVLGAYVLENDRRQEEQKSSENTLRKQRLNAEHQLSVLEKQLISCNTKLTKYEKNLLDVKTKLEQREEYVGEIDKKYEETRRENIKITEELAQIKQKYSHLEDEKIDIYEIVEKKNKEIERLNTEWNEMSTKLHEANKVKCEIQYKLDEIKNSDVRKEFKEKRLEQEKVMMQQTINQLKADLQERTSLATEFKKDNISKILDLETKKNMLEQENLQLKKLLEASKKTVKEQEDKVESLFTKLKRAAEEHVEVENNMQQELTSQTKLVKLYKDDRDHAKQKLDEVMVAVTELQKIVKDTSDEKEQAEAKLIVEIEEQNKKIDELNTKIKQQSMELENANDLLQLTRKKGGSIVPDQSLSSLSPMAAASSAILKKGMTLTQIYTEYVKLSDELVSEKEENSRLKLYMEQILQEVEEKAPVLMKQKESYEHAVKTIQNMSLKMEENIKECHRMKTEHGELERNLSFHKREEKRLRTLCVDLSQQVRVLLKEVEEARGGIVSSSSDQTKLLSEGDALNTSSAGAVISEHLVTFKSIEELQAQNERLLLTVRQLSEEQEKLEQEGGPDMIQELKKKIQNANSDLENLKENQRTQEEMMEQLARQRDMYKVLCQKGGVMVSDISSTSVIGNRTLEDVETELTKTKAELDKSVGDHMKLKEETADKQHSLQDTINKMEDEISSLKLESDRLRNQLTFSEEKYSILTTSSEGFKKEAKALEEKCRSINEAFVKTRVEAEKHKQDYSELKEKYVSTEIVIKSLETEKTLVREAEKRLMQENQSLLEQQRSQNVLLTNLQTIQNNLERQEFETRQTLSKQVENLQREMRALRRQSENEGSQLKISASSLEKELNELKIRLGVEMEKNKTLENDVAKAKQQAENLESKCKELENLNTASEKRLASILEDDTGNKDTALHIHEIERYKTRVRELEMELSNVANSKKGVEDHLNVMKKHLEQYKEIGESNEQAITDITKAKEALEKELTKKIEDLTNALKATKTQLTSVVAEKLQLKKTHENLEKNFQAKVADVRAQAAPLEKRYQDLTKALVHAKEMETAATNESKEQCKIAKEAQDKYEREIVLHARDVEQLTQVKEELKATQNRFAGMDVELSSLRQGKANSDVLLQQMQQHKQEELKKGEQVRKDLIAQNSILHGQVEKLSAQLAAAKSQNRNDETIEKSDDKSMEEVYELLRFVRREKEISETKAEALETESMRYRQRAEHLQRDLEESKKALELEFERTKGRMLTEQEHKEVTEKVKKAKEYEVLNKELEKQKTIEINKSKILQEKARKLEEQLKPLQENKKTLENEKNTWLAEKTALKSEIERWTARTNQLMAQTTKAEGDEVKKLQLLKTQNEKTISALQDEIKRTRQQLDFLKRETLKIKNENSEFQAKITSLQNELLASKSALNFKQQQQPGSTQPPTSTSTDVPKEANESQQKAFDETKKDLDAKTKELTDKNKMITQLKRIGKRYKTQSEKLQALLKENNIEFQHIVTGQAASSTGTESETNQAPQQVMDSEEKKKLQEQISEKIITINEITTKLTSLETMLSSEKTSRSEIEKKLAESQQHHGETEKKLLEAKKEIEKLNSEIAEDKESKDKNRRFLKTAKDKIASLTKMKDAALREVEETKKQLQDARNQQQQQTQDDKEEKQTIDQLNSQISQIQKLNEDFKKEKAMLEAHVEQLKTELDEEKKSKNRIQVVSSSSEVTTQEPVVSAPLTATVRPTANTDVTKHHTQNTPTASIRPLAHSAPTAMISPVPTITQQAQASDALQPSASVQPFATFRRTAPVLAVQVLSTRDEASSSTDSQVPSTSDEPSSTRPTKRTHVDVEEEDANDVTVPDSDEANDGPANNKRQRVEQTINESQDTATDSQDGQMEEDELLSEEGNDDEVEGDDDVMEAQTQQLPPSQGEQSQGTSREQRLINERNLIPSPQELIRQQRSNQRGRSQLPSFSLPANASNAYYEEYADDGTVPSTPTLYVAKRTDGFAEAVSSPVVRFQTFSFNNEQAPSSSQTPALEQSGELVQATRMDLLGADELASVPQTPLSVVPSVVSDSALSSGVPNADQEEQNQQQQQYFEPLQEEQNVPQQIDLTEDDDNEEDDEEGDEDVYEGVDSQDGGIEIFAPEGTEDNLDQDVGETVEESEGEEEEESSSSSGSDNEDEDDIDNEDIDDGDNVVEDNDDENDGDNEEEEQVVAEIEGDDDDNDVDDSNENQEGDDEAAPLQSDNVDPSTVDSGITIDSSISRDDFPHSSAQDDKPKPVRLQRSTQQGVRPRIRRDVLKGRQGQPKPGTG